MNPTSMFDERWLGAAIHSDHWHFHQRLFERYRLVLKPGEFSALVKCLRAQKLPKLQDRGNGIAVYVYQLRRRKLIYILALGGQPRTVLHFGKGQRLEKRAAKIAARSPTASAEA